MQSLEFLVKGSTGNEYKVRFERVGENINGYCSCPAGENGMYCKHRFSLMDGVVDDLISENTNDVERLKELMAGTDVEKVYIEVLAVQAEYNQLDARLKALKRALAQSMRR